MRMMKGEVTRHGATVIITGWGQKQGGARAANTEVSPRRASLTGDDKRKREERGSAKQGEGENQVLFSVTCAAAIL